MALPTNAPRACAVLAALLLGCTSTTPAQLRGEVSAAPKTGVPTPESTATQLDIGLLIWSDNIPGQVAMRAGIEAEATRINANQGPGRPAVRLHTAVAGDGPDGIDRQISQMRGFIADDMDLLIVQPTHNAALSAPLLEANAAGVPVIAYDQYIKGGELAAYLTSDNAQAGRLDGEYIASRFPDTQDLKLVLVEYPQVSSTVERLDAFLEALKKANQPYTVVGSYQAVDPESGAAAAAQILADHPAAGSIDVVFTVNDGGGLAIVDALLAAGRHEILVATIDGDPTSVAHIAAGELTVIDSAQFCGLLGSEAMKAAYAVGIGKPGPRHLLVPTFPITASTLDQYPGWMGPYPEPFSLPWPSDPPTWQPTPRVAEGPPR